MRFAITARSVARQRADGFDSLNEMTTLNVKKVTQFRKDGVEELEDTIKRLELQKGEGGLTPGKNEAAGTGSKRQ